MDVMLKAIAKVLKVLNSETEPGQISLAFCFSMIAGLTPLLSLHNLLVILLVLLFRVNLSTFILGLVFFSGVAYLFDPLFHWIGLTVLTVSGLEGLWTLIYNMTLFRLEKFNDTVAALLRNGRTPPEKAAFLIAQSDRIIGCVW